jgi:hypothetical protein
MKNKIRINGVHIEIRNEELLITARFVTSFLTAIIRDWQVFGMFPFQISVGIACLVLCVRGSLQPADKLCVLLFPPVKK